MALPVGSGQKSPEGEFRRSSRNPTSLLRRIDSSRPVGASMAKRKSASAGRRLRSLPLKYRRHDKVLHHQVPCRRGHHIKRQGPTPVVHLKLHHPGAFRPEFPFWYKDSRHHVPGSTRNARLRVNARRETAVHGQAVKAGNIPVQRQQNSTLFTALVLGTTQPCSQWDLMRSSLRPCGAWLPAGDVAAQHIEKKPRPRMRACFAPASGPPWAGASLYPMFFFMNPAPRGSVISMNVADEVV